MMMARNKTLPPILLGAVIALAGCNSDANPPETDGLIAWGEGPGNSKVALFNQSEVSRAMNRCWPSEGMQLCLHAYQLTGDNGSLVYVSSGYRDALPARSDQFFDEPKNAYSCVVGGTGNSEEISGDQGKLDSNSFGAFGLMPWPRDKVQKFLKDNRLKGFYFDCPAIADAIRAGSLATLATSKITQSMAASQKD